MPRRGENIYKRKDGRWEGRYICARKPDGGAQYRSIYGRTYGEVREKLLALREEARRFLLEQCPLTVKELTELWLAEEQPNVKPSSYERYRLLVEKHIVPQLGRLRLHELTAEKLSAFLSEKSQRGRLDGMGGLAPKTVGDIYTVLRSVLTLAQRRYHCPQYVSRSEVQLPQPKRTEIEVFSTWESAQITREILNAPTLSNGAFLLCLETGLRLGELCALKWSDIDFREGVLAVRRTALRINHGGRTVLTVQTPKSDASKRAIPLTADMLSLLQRVRGNAAEDAYVLTGKEDKPMEPRTIQYRFRRFQLRLGLRPRNFHTLRHSFATRCVEHGADVKSLSELFGHSNVKTTLQMYVHPSMEQKRRCLEQSSVFSSCA